MADENKESSALWMSVDDQDEAIALLWDAVRALPEGDTTQRKILDWLEEHK